MGYEIELQLVDSLQDINRLIKILAPLFEKGREEFDQLSSSINHVLERVSPSYTVAFAGPVNSGKSTVLSSLLREDKDPITPSGPSNETFAPMIIDYSKHPMLLVQYFGVDIINQILRHLSDLEKHGESAHEVAKCSGS